MNTLRILKTNNNLSFYSLLNWFFILSGTKFYLDYILITNPTSKNPIIRSLYRYLQNPYSATDYKSRFNMALAAGTIHVIGVILYTYLDMFYSWSNLLINIYPIIIQIYVGYRLYLVKQSKRKPFIKEII